MRKKSMLKIMTPIHIWKKYSTTYLGLVPNFKERPGWTKSSICWTLSHANIIILEIKSHFPIKICKNLWSVDNFSTFSNELAMFEQSYLLCVYCSLLVISCIPPQSRVPRSIALETSSINKISNLRQASSGQYHIKSFDYGQSSLLSIFSLIATAFSVQPYKWNYCPAMLSPK